MSTLDRSDLGLLMTMAVVGAKAKTDDFYDWLAGDDDGAQPVEAEPWLDPWDWDDLFAATTGTVDALVDTPSSRAMRATVRRISSPWLRIVIAASVASEHAERDDFETWIAGFGDVVRDWLDDAEFTHRHCL